MDVLRTLVSGTEELESDTQIESAARINATVCYIIASYHEGETNELSDEKTINQAYQSAADGVLSGILDFSNEPLVSTDYKGNKSSCVIDGLSTLSINNNLVKVVGWYDNEWGYSCRTIELAKYIASKGL